MSKIRIKAGVATSGIQRARHAVPKFKPRKLAGPRRNPLALPSTGQVDKLGRRNPRMLMGIQVMSRDIDATARAEDAMKVMRPRPM